MAKYKMVVSDLDGTLLGSDRLVSERNEQAIRTAREEGVRFVPATGRNYLSVERILAQLDLDGKQGEYLIAYNGGAILENQGHRVLGMVEMSFDLADALYRHGYESGVCTHVYTFDREYVCNVDDWQRSVMNRYQFLHETNERTLDFLRGSSVLKIMYTSQNVPFLESVRDSISNELTDRIETASSSGRSLELTPAGVVKGRAVTALASLLGIPMSEVLAIGDNLNDVSMLEAAGLGVAVRNAEPETMDAADTVSIYTNDDDAVARILESIVL